MRSPTLHRDPIRPAYRYTTWPTYSPHRPISPFPMLRLSASLPVPASPEPSHPVQNTKQVDLAAQPSPRARLAAAAAAAASQPRALMHPDPTHAATSPRLAPSSSPLEHTQREACPHTKHSAALYGAARTLTYSQRRAAVVADSDTQYLTSLHVRRERVADAAMPALVAREAIGRAPSCGSRIR